MFNFCKDREKCRTFRHELLEKAFLNLTITFLVNVNRDFIRSYSDFLDILFEFYLEKSPFKVRLMRRIAFAMKELVRA